MDDVFRGFDMAGGAFGIVLGNEVGDGSRNSMGSHLVSEPVKAANVFLEELDEFSSFIW